MLTTGFTIHLILAIINHIITIETITWGMLWLHVCGKPFVKWSVCGCSSRTSPDCYKPLCFLFQLNSVQRNHNLLYAINMLLLLMPLKYSRQPLLTFNMLKFSYFLVVTVSKKNNLCYISRVGRFNCSPDWLIGI